MEQPKVNRLKRTDKIPATSPESDAFSKDLKKRGLNFVGSKIIYAYMQAVGMVNDHLVECFRYREVQRPDPASARVVAERISPVRRQKS